MSTQNPKLESPALVSALSTDPTLMVPPAAPTGLAHASMFWLPAAVTMGMPAAIARFSMLTIPCAVPGGQGTGWGGICPSVHSGPRLMLITAGFVAFLMTQSMPLMMYVSDALPLQSNTRTATMLTFLATPYALPPSTPATAVPWPKQSSALSVLLVVFLP